MGRRTFIGRVLGTFAATSLPWIGEEALSEPSIKGLLPAIELPDKTLIKAPPIEELIYHGDRGTYELRLATVTWEKMPDWVDILMSSVRFVTDNHVLYAAKVAAMGSSSGGYGVVVNLPRNIRRAHPRFIQKLEETYIPYIHER